MSRQGSLFSTDKDVERRRKRAEQARIRRAKESEEKRALRREENRVRSRNYRAKESESGASHHTVTGEQNKLSLKDDAEEIEAKKAEGRLILHLKAREGLTKALRVNEEAESDISQKRNKGSSGNGAEEKRRLFLKRRAEKSKLRRAKETLEQRILRLQKNALATKLRRAKETEEQLILRRQRNTLSKKLYRGKKAKEESFYPQLQHKGKLQTIDHSRIIETEEHTLRATQELKINADKDPPPVECFNLGEIRRMKLSVEALKSAGLTLIKFYVRIAVEKITGRKVQTPKNDGKETRSRLYRMQCIDDRFELLGESWKNIKGFLSIPVHTIDEYSNSNSPVVNKLFVCIVCKEQFNNRSGLMVHIRNHSGLEITNANIQDGSTKEKLNQNEGSSDRLTTNVRNEVIHCYKCQFCPESFLSISKFRRHLIVGHNEKRDLFKELCLPCSICGDLLESKAQLVQHQKVEHNVFVQCPICSENIASEDTFASHLNESHPEIGNSSEMIFKFSKGFFCKICGFTGKSPYQISSHFQNIHSENKSFQCDICGQHFAFKKALETHKQNVHSQKLYCCEVCGKKFSKKSVFRAHQKKHDKVEPKAQCKVCKKMFATTSTLDVHIRAIHRKEKAYQCAICGMAFACQSTLHIHKTLTCEKEKAKAATCPICGKVFENYRVLGHHKSNIHKYGNTEETVCHLCDKTFKNSQVLYMHNNAVHNRKNKTDANGIVDLTCSVCEKKYTSKSLLFDHWRTHREEKPFQCSFCGNTFKQRTGFYLHRKLKHKNDKTNLMITDFQTQTKLREIFNQDHASQLSVENQHDQLSAMVEAPESQKYSCKAELSSEIRFDCNLVNNVQDLNDIRTESNTTNAVSGLEASDHQVANSYQSVIEEHVIDVEDVTKQVNEVIAENKMLDKPDIEVLESSTDNENPIAGVISGFGDEFVEENIHEALLGELGQMNETECFFDDGDDLLDHFTCQNSPLPVYDKNEIKLENNEDPQRRVRRFSQDPFARQLSISLVKLKEYSCSPCDKVLYTLQLYKKHLRSRNHRCEARKKQGIGSENAEDKIIVKEIAEAKTKYKSRVGGQNKSDWICVTCGKCFANRFTLGSHRKLHDEAAKKQCPHCDKKFPHMSQYKQHIQSEHMGRRFRCEICGNMYRREYHLKCHVKTHGEVEMDGKSTKIVLTGNCKEKGNQLEKLRIEKSEKFICESCGKQCLTKRGLYKHLKSHATIVNLNCDHCSKSFSSTSKLKDHVNSVHLKLKLLCSECGKQYSSMSTLSEHKRIHMGTPRKRRGPRSKIYNLKITQCEHCPKTFTNGAVYKMHVNTAHLGIKITCEECGKVFSNSVSMFKHRRSHKNSQYNFCSICSLSFNTQDAYDRHVNSIHDPTRPFPCDQCQSFFKYHSNLLHHKKNAHLKLGIVYKKKKSRKPCQSEPELKENSVNNITG